MDPTLALAMDLVRRRSITPADAGCQQIIADRLAAAGFACEHLRFGEVDNLWARRGTAAPLLVFLGHTDVVPPGPAAAWASDPFTPTLRDGHLYGRGAADMKGAIAAMTTAAERFVARHPRHRGSLAMLLTSDEEGAAVDGTVRVIEHLAQNGHHIDWCLVGEPSSEFVLGDVVKNGRRGSLNGILTLMGVQGHVAYPERADNPIHRAMTALAALVSERWDEGNEFYPPTSFQISNIEAGTGAENVIPGELRAMFNFRYSTAQTPGGLEARTRALLDRFGLRYSIEWRSSGLPFLTSQGELLEAARAAARAAAGMEPRLSTAGGTSDGRFVAPTGAQIVELGAINATIHKVDECTSVDDLARLSAIYEGLLDRLLGLS